MIAVILTNGEAVAAKHYEPSHGVIELVKPGGVDDQRTLSLQHGEWSRCGVHAVPTHVVSSIVDIRRTWRTLGISESDAAWLEGRENA